MNSVPNKGNCAGCQRKILSTTRDHCMYCGAPLPEEQRFSKAEKAAIQAKQDRLFLESRIQSKQRKYLTSDRGAFPLG